MTVEDVFRPVGNDALPAHGVEVLHHDGKGLNRPPLALTQGLDSLFIAGITAEVEAADALDGDDFSINNRLSGRNDGLTAPFGPVQEIDFRTAVVTADRLGIVTPRFGVGIFIFALGTHGELAHTRPFAVVRHGIEDGQPRATGRAVDEGVEIAAVGLIEELRFAGIADGNVRRHEDIAFFPGALDDGKILVRRPVFRRRDDFQDSRPFRRLAFQIIVEGHQRRRGTLGQDFHIRALIADRPVNSMSRCNAADKGPKADALDDAKDTNPFRMHLIPSRTRRNAGNRRIGRGSSAGPGGNRHRRG